MSKQTEKKGVNCAISLPMTEVQTSNKNTPINKTRQAFEKLRWVLNQDGTNPRGNLNAKQLCLVE